MRIRITMSIILCSATKKCTVGVGPNTVVHIYENTYSNTKAAVRQSALSVLWKQSDQPQSKLRHAEHPCVGVTFGFGI